MKSQKYPEIIAFLKEKGINKTRLAASLALSRQYLDQLLLGERKMSDAILDHLNRSLNTKFTHPKPTPETLPHEQLALDRESLKEKPLFKDE